MLSTGFFTIGHPRHTICVPVPICVEKELLHPVMVDYSTFPWSAYSYARQDIRGYDAPIPEEWLAFEEKAFAEYERAQEEARKLMREDKKDSAIEKINKAASLFRDEAARLMGL